MAGYWNSLVCRLDHLSDSTYHFICQVLVDTQFKILPLITSCLSRPHDILFQVGSWVAMTKVEFASSACLLLALAKLMLVFDSGSWSVL